MRGALISNFYFDLNQSSVGNDFGCVGKPRCSAFTRIQPSSKILIEQKVASFFFEGDFFSENFQKSKNRKTRISIENFRKSKKMKFFIFHFFEKFQLKSLFFNFPIFRNFRPTKNLKSRQTLEQDKIKMNQYFFNR